MADIKAKVHDKVCENTSQKPRNHFKCRYDGNSDAKNALFTRTKDVHRFPVPTELSDWKVSYAGYKPTNFTSDKIKAKKGAYVDPEVDQAEFKTVKFNDTDHAYKCDRASHHGKYEMIPFSEEIPVLVPQNPVGRTGIIGRGHLGRWGPNHAADAIVTQWKRDDHKKRVRDKTTGKPILQFIAIQRRDTKEWAIPGGMRDPGEVVTKTLIREFAEEALSKNLKFNSEERMEATCDFEESLHKFFTNGIEVYKGYVDDPRNTDNSWMETFASNFHDEKSEVVSQFNLQGGDDAQSAQWMDLSSSLLLFASHKDFIYTVVKYHDAHW